MTVEGAMSEGTPYAKPLPAVSSLNRPYWDGL